jgi:uncharacterized membrane protein
MEQDTVASDREVNVLLAQYQVAASHHIQFLSLIWQVPAIAVAVAGGIAGVSFTTRIPALRTALQLFGALFMFVMILALERYRMFQLRRRRDMEVIEERLASSGALRLRWSGEAIADEIRQGQFSAPGVRLYAAEGYAWLRILMYVVMLFLVVLGVLTAVGGG